ncbi:MAG: acyl--CoA ligase [Chitinispirillaceae bacterium]|nr:acyl--CoA ligase [Chitinispirillaceae bacterium]
MDTMPAKLVHGFLRQSAERFPDKTAVIHENRRASYDEIFSGSRNLAAHLTASGVQKGDRVVLMHENSVEYVVAYYGILIAGGVVVSLNPGTQPDGLRPLFDELSPTAVVASVKVTGTLRTIGGYPDSLRQIILTRRITTAGGPLPIPVTIFDDLPAPAPDFREPDIDENDLAAIIYTSGSTGKPKGVMLTHRNIVANTYSICSYLELTENDIQMAVLPFFYVMGKSLLNTHVAAGGTVVINNKFAFPASVVQQMINEKVTGFSGVPSTFAYLLHRSPLAASREKLISLRYVSQAGGHMARQIKLALRKALPGHTKIIIMYGATEASARLTWLDPGHFSEKIDSIGKAIPGVTISIVGPDGGILPPNQTGEIVASGDNIMRGYWQNEKATRKVLDRNGYHTGDMGYMDGDGYIYVTGRSDNQLKAGGHRVDPQEIEDAIMESDLLIELSVIGIPDRLMGNRLVGLSAPVGETVTENSVLAFAAKALPRHKVPSAIHFVKSLPKNANGKIDRAACERIIMERSGSSAA